MIKWLRVAFAVLSLKQSGLHGLASFDIGLTGNGNSERVLLSVCLGFARYSCCQANWCTTWNRISTNINANLSPTLGDVAQMVERPLSMREVRRSMRLFSIFVFFGFCFASQDLLPTRYARHISARKAHPTAVSAGGLHTVAPIVYLQIISSKTANPKDNSMSARKHTLRQPPNFFSIFCSAVHFVGFWAVGNNAQADPHHELPSYFSTLVLSNTLNGGRCANFSHAASFMFCF